MISGRFGENGELFFERELIASNGDSFPGIIEKAIAQLLPIILINPSLTPWRSKS